MNNTTHITHSALLADKHYQGALGIAFDHIELHDGTIGCAIYTHTHTEITGALFRIIGDFQKGRVRCASLAGDCEKVFFISKDFLKPLAIALPHYNDYAHLGDLQKMAASLANREWADHIASTSEGRELEVQITEMHNQLNLISESNSAHDHVQRELITLLKNINSELNLHRELRDKPELLEALTSYGIEPTQSFSGTIGVSMNGLRRNLTEHVKDLKRIALRLGDENLTDCTSEIIKYCNSLNCCHTDLVEDFSDLTDLFIELIEECGA